MKCVYIYNPNSGKQNNDKIKDYVVTKLKTKFDVVDVRPTTQKGDGGQFAANACGCYDVIVVSGGDGTFSEIINAIAEKENRPQIGYIPTGTTNDLAHSLRIPKNVKKAINIILNGKIVKHDIFKINDVYGIYVCAFGLFTASSYSASQKSKRRFGKLAYYFSGAKELKDAKKFAVTLKTDTIAIDANVVLGLVVNNKYVSGYKINKMADCSDGFVNVILLKEKKKKGVSLKMLLNILKLFLFGMKTLKNSKECIILKLNKFSLEFEEDAVINIDGEKGLNGSFNLEVLKQHVEIFVRG